jgi:hypothetical protein
MRSSLQRQVECEDSGRDLVAEHADSSPSQAPVTAATNRSRHPVSSGGQSCDEFAEHLVSVKGMRIAEKNTGELRMPDRRGSLRGKLVPDCGDFPDGAEAVARTGGG